MTTVKLTLSFSLLAASLMLTTPAQAEIWSCSAAVGSHPITFTRKDGHFVTQSNFGSKPYKIIFENETSIQLVEKPGKRPEMEVLVLFKKSKRFEMVSLAGPNLEFPVPSRPAGYTKGSCLTN